MQNAEQQMDVPRVIKTKFLVHMVVFDVVSNAPTHFWRSESEPKCVSKLSGDCSQVLDWVSCRRKNIRVPTKYCTARKTCGWGITFLAMLPLICGLQICLTIMYETRLKGSLVRLSVIKMNWWRGCAKCFKICLMRL